MALHKILIVEDEAAAAQALKDALERYGAEHAVQFKTTCITSALNVTEAAFSAADLVFMDIDLPGGNGLDTAIELRRHNHTTPLVFVTNLAQYAVRGYAAEALDFIVKPFTYGAFAMRMDRALAVMQRQAQRSITLKSRDGIRVVTASDLVFIETQGHGVRYHLADGGSFEVRESLTHAFDALVGSPFLRVSSSCAINMAFVRGVHDLEVTLADGTTAWISRANRKRCLDELARYLGGDA